MRRAALGLACAALLLAAPAADARPGGPRVVQKRATCARVAKAHAKRHHAKASACAVKRRLVGVTGAGLLGGPAAFSAAIAFTSGAAAPAASVPAAAGALAATPTPTPDPGSTLPTVPTNPHAVQVQAFEYGLQLSKGTVSSGTVRVEFNSTRAEDTHNLELIRTDGTGQPLTFDQQPSGAVTAQSLPLAAGTYRLFCSLPQHDSLGMHATLTVTAG
jgi:plastocyanin